MNLDNGMISIITYKLAYLFETFLMKSFLLVSKMYIYKA